MGSFQKANGTGSSGLLETSCGYLLQELQIIWDEVGEDQFEREKVLLELEQECLEVHRRKVDNANISRARLHQQLAESEAQFTHLLLSLGERSLPGRPGKMTGTLKEQLNSITPALREMQLRKEDRVKQFRVVQMQIHKISAEIAGRTEYSDSSPSVSVNENDLSLKKLQEYQNELQRLHTEKSDRLQKVERHISTIKNLSATLGMDSSLIITKVHPSLNELSGLSKNISDVILEKLDSTVKSLESERQMRLNKLQQLGKSLADLWNLMDTPYKDRQPFLHVTNRSSLASSEISTPGSLTLDIAQQVCLHSTSTLIHEVSSIVQEQKKAQSKVVIEHEGHFGSRPGTSSRRLSDKSSNGGLTNAKHLNRKRSQGLQQIRSNSITSPTQGRSFIKEGNGARGIYTQKGFAHLFREDTLSVASSFSGPLSL